MLAWWRGTFHYHAWHSWLCLVSNPVKHYHTHKHTTTTVSSCRILPTNILRDACHTHTHTNLARAQHCHTQLCHTTRCHIHTHIHTHTHQCVAHNIVSVSYNIVAHNSVTHKFVSDNWLMPITATHLCNTHFPSHRLIYRSVFCRHPFSWLPHRIFHAYSLPFKEVDNVDMSGCPRLLWPLTIINPSFFPCLTMNHQWLGLLPRPRSAKPPGRQGRLQRHVLTLLVLQAFHFLLNGLGHFLHLHDAKKEMNGTVITEIIA